MGTGEMVQPNTSLTTTQAGELMARLVAPILWPEDQTLSVESSTQKKLGNAPLRMPPLRHDRESSCYF